MLYVGNLCQHLRHTLLVNNLTSGSDCMCSGISDKIEIAVTVTTIRCQGFCRLRAMCSNSFILSLIFIIKHYYFLMPLQTSMSYPEVCKMHFNFLLRALQSFFAPLDITNYDSKVSNYIVILCTFRHYKD